MSFNTVTDWLSLNSNLLLGATWETLYMVAVAGVVLRRGYSTRCYSAYH